MNCGSCEWWEPKDAKPTVRGPEMSGTCRAVPPVLACNIGWAQPCTGASFPACSFYKISMAVKGPEGVQ